MTRLAAAVMPISFALIADSFPMEERQQALGTFIGIAFLGQGLSMAMGGIISYFFDLHGVFLTGNGQKSWTPQGAVMLG